VGDDGRCMDDDGEARPGLVARWLGARRWRHRLDLVRRRLILLGTPRSAGEPSSDLERRFRAACRELEAPSVLELGTKQAVPGHSTMHRDWVPHASEFLGTDIEHGADVDIVA